MGRLFWKFFTFILLAQLAAMVAVGTIFSIEHHAEKEAWMHKHIHEPPPADFDITQGIPPHPPHPPHPHGPIPVVPLTATFIASLVCAALLARYFSRPIRVLRKALAGIAEGDLSARVGSDMGNRHDELADLGNDFDHMANQLSAVIESQRKLLHDVSHELRSPLARLQVAVGLAKQNPEKINVSLDRIELESNRIDFLVGELLTLARLEAGLMDVKGEEVPLHELLLEIVEDARFEAKVRQQIVSFKSSCNVMWIGRIELLHRAIENVVRNALKFTPDAKNIDVSCVLDKGKQSVLIAVADEGPGAPEPELKDMFKPFFRGNGAQGANGYGLGLAIAERVIQAYGGSISAKNRPIGGLLVEISLPIVRELT